MIPLPRFDAPACPWKQIFVLSLPRSGSTLVRLLLDTHPMIACPGELYLGRLSEALHHAWLYSVGQLATSDEAEREALATREVERTIDRLMSRYLAAKGKTIWAEKTPANVDHAERLRAVFPAAAFVCLYRHPFDAIRSGFESTRFGRLKCDLWDYRKSCEFYIEQTQKLLDFERRNRACCVRLSYEALVRDTAAAVGALFDFLRLPWERTLLDRIFSTPRDSGPGDPKAALAARIYDTSIGRGADILPILNELPSSLRTTIASLGLELGYAPLDFAAPAPDRSAPGSGVSAGVAAVQSVDEVFRSFVPRKLERSAPALGGLRGAVKFLVKGAGGGTWTIDLDRTPPIVAQVDQHADCVIAIRADDLLKLVSGQLSMGECYLQAKLRLQGNEALAVSLGRTLFA